MQIPDTANASNDPGKTDLLVFGVAGDVFQRPKGVFRWHV
jgi:hypothetical protein